MNTRMQVTLSAEQHRRVKQKAAAAGLSLAEYLRRVVAADLDEDTPPRDVSEIFALFDTGASDVATHKDEYVAEALRGRHARRGGQPG